MMPLLFLFAPVIVTGGLIFVPRYLFSRGCEEILKSFGYKIGPLDIMALSFIGFLLQIAFITWLFNIPVDAYGRI